MTPKDTIVSVFGSSRVKPGSADYELARELGRELATRGFTICSGGYGGVMEAVSRGAREAGGHAIGVTARAFRATANPWIEREIRVQTWQERLFDLVRRGRGYVACTGGTGTLVELAVVWEMLSKGLIRAKPLTVLGTFWAPVIEQVSRADAGRSSESFRRGAHVIHQASSPVDAARYLASQLLVLPGARRPR